jgi:AraC-like DNA-binding protein
MAKKAKVLFDPKLFLANVDGGSAVSKYRKKQTVWRVVKCKRAAEAALIAGFADQSHMSRAFVRQFGVTPGRYQAALA